MPWRDNLPEHPAAALFPLMTGEELQELAADITKHGLRTPVAVLVDTDGKRLLDGRNRLDACALAGIAVFNDEGNLEILNKTIEDGPDFDPFAYVVSLNLHRRHLTREQRREIIAVLLREHPERSDAATARIAGVSDHTVASVRRDQEARSQIASVATRTDTRGRQQPATQPARRAATETEPSMLSQGELREARAARSQTIVQLHTLLRLDTGATLKEIVRVLGDSRGAIAALPESERIAAARGCLGALAINTDQLGPVR
jgi:ParB-like chromosome segregation protein Spo0J